MAAALAERKPGAPFCDGSSANSVAACAPNAFTFSSFLLCELLCIVTELVFRKAGAGDVKSAAIKAKKGNNCKRSEAVTSN